MKRLEKCFRGFSECCQQIKETWEQSKKTILALSVITLVALSALLRVSFTNRDDMLRVADGYRGWYLGNRYVNDILAALIHAGRWISDISPLSQMIAIFLMAVASTITLRIFSEGQKIGWLQVFAVMPRIVFPYFLVCLSYKFDSPYMALSVLAGTFPLLYASKNTKKYLLISFLGTLICCMTYQASLGTYPILVLFYCYVKWNRGVWGRRKTLWFTVSSAASYLIALVLYKLAFVRYVIPYAPGNVFSIRNLPRGVLNNYRTLYGNLNKDLIRSWKVLLVVLTICFILSMILSTKRNRIASGLLCVGMLLVTSFLTVGPLIVFEGQPFSARYSYGIATPIAAMAAILSYTKGFYVGKLAAIGISWCFIVFSLTYGNAESEQMHYVDVRCGQILSDMKDVIGDTPGTEYLFEGSCGYAPTIQKLVKRMPLLKRMQLQNVGHDYFGGYYFALHYAEGLSTYNPYIDINTLEDRRVLVDNYSHRIEQSGNVYIIDVKKVKRTTTR